MLFEGRHVTVAGTLSYFSQCKQLEKLVMEESCKSKSLSKTHPRHKGGAAGPNIPLWNTLLASRIDRVNKLGRAGKNMRGNLKSFTQLSKLEKLVVSGAKLIEG